MEVLSIDTVQVFVHYALAELFLGSHLALLQTSGTLPADKARQWWEYLQHADDHGTLLISFTGLHHRRRQELILGFWIVMAPPMS